MHERGLVAYTQAKIEIPRRFYEDEYIRSSVILVGLSLGLMLAISGEIKLGVPLHHLMGGISYILSSLADSQSTLKGFRANDRAIQTGLNSLTREGNSLLAHVKSADEYIAAKKIRLTRNVLLGTVSTIFPPVAVGIAMGTTLAVINNHRVSKRINRTIEIALNESKAD